MSVETLRQSNESSMGSSELAVSTPLSAVSIIAYVLALGVLLYYKMWHTFIYRLVLYMFVLMIFFSLSAIINATVVILLKEASEVNTTTNATHGSDIAVLSFLFMLVTSSLASAYMLVTCITVCIYLMALHNYQFTYKSDLCLLVLSILYLMIVIILTVIWRALRLFSDRRGVTLLNIFALPFLVDVVFIALTLVPLCCRACGYNLCMKTAATIESHRKALREILPFFILIVPSFLVIVVWLVWFSIASGFIGGDHNIDADFNDILSVFIALGTIKCCLFCSASLLYKKESQKVAGQEESIKNC